MHGVEESVGPLQILVSSLKIQTLITLSQTRNATQAADYGALNFAFDFDATAGCRNAPCPKTQIPPQS